jgi:HAD superfamily hydrolase (TIGR01509 family)
VSVLLLDCDGVLADTERDGHLVAFNRMFTEFRLPVRWTEAEYGRRLAIGGGKERLRTLLTSEFSIEAGLPEGEEAQAETVAAWHRRKTEIFADMIDRGLIPARPGIARIVDDAVTAGWKLAVVSTSARESVAAVVHHVLARHEAAVAIFAGDLVAAKKPAPDIYVEALRALGADPRDAIAIEDSRNGLRAAAGAGLQCLVTVSSYTRGEEFDEAALVVSDLGDPGCPPIEVLAHRGVPAPTGYVGLDDLAACIVAGQGVA